MVSIVPGGFVRSGDWNCTKEMSTGGAGPKPTAAPAAPSGEVVKGGELAKAKQSDSKQTDPKQAYEEKADATKEGEQKLAAAQRGWDRFGTTHNLAILPQPTGLPRSTAGAT